MLTSVAAVDAVKEQLGAAAPADLAALAPSTSNALKRLDLKPSIESSDGVVALAEVVGRSLQARGIRSASFWYPTSAAGLDSLEQSEAIETLSRFGSVTRVAAYDVTAPSQLASQLRVLPREVGVLFSSPSAVRHFIEGHDRLGLIPSVRMAACWGASTHREAQAHFADTHLLPRFRPLAEALRELEISHG